MGIGAVFTLAHTWRDEHGGPTNSLIELPTYQLHYIVNEDAWLNFHKYVVGIHLVDVVVVAPHSREKTFMTFLVKTRGRKNSENSSQPDGSNLKSLE